MVSRILSLVIAAAYVADFHLKWGLPLSFYYAVGQLLPLACIWYGDALADCRPAPVTVLRSSGAAITPGRIIALLGWFLLLTPTIGPWFARLVGL